MTANDSENPNNWLGQTWFKDNNRKYPSMAQIEEGLIEEAGE